MTLNAPGFTDSTHCIYQYTFSQSVRQSKKAASNKTLTMYSVARASENSVDNFPIVKNDEQQRRRRRRHTIYNVCVAALCLQRILFHSVTLCMGKWWCCKDMKKKKKKKKTNMVDGLNGFWLKANLGRAIHSEI